MSEDQEKYNLNKDNFPFPKEFDAMIQNIGFVMLPFTSELLRKCEYKESRIMYLQISSYFFSYKNSPLQGWLIHESELEKTFEYSLKKILKVLPDLQKNNLILFKKLKGNYYLIFIIYEQIQTFIDSLKNDEYEISLTPKIVLKATEKHNIVQLGIDLLMNENDNDLNPIEAMKELFNKLRGSEIDGTLYSKSTPVSDKVFCNILAAAQAISFLAFPRNKQIDNLTDQMLLIGEKKRLRKEYYHNMINDHKRGINPQSKLILPDWWVNKTNIIFNRVFK